MKLDFDFSAVSRFFQGLVGEFKQKKLWPVAAVLLVAIVAVPLLLSKSSSPTPVAQAPLPTPAPATGSSLPTINVQSTTSNARLTGAAHNPFAQGTAGTSTTTTTTTSSSSTGSTSGSTGSTSSGSTSTSTGSSSGSSSTTTSGSTPVVSPPSTTGKSKPKPASTGLKSTQSYSVGLAVTNSAGGVDTDRFERLSPIPSRQQPLLVQLGVLQGGSKVLFAVMAGTVVKGPGTCTPGPIDCEILSLGRNQTESISSSDSGANALLAVTSITAVTHSTVASAKKARETKSGAGQTVLDSSSSMPALSLFKYEPSVGAVVDLRDLRIS